jgi:hypothetical protein
MTEKIERLQDILNKLLLYSKHYNKVQATINNDIIHVIWSSPKDWEWFFEDVEFPLIDIDQRIIHYTNKIDYYEKKYKEAGC